MDSRANGGIGIPGFSLNVVSSYGERRLLTRTQPRRVFGVPPGGPFDRLSAAFARALVHAAEEGPILEITLGPVVFEAQDDVTVAVVGGPDGAFSLRQGDRFDVRPIGARAYVAVGSGSARRLADPPRASKVLRVVAGPQADVLDLERFLSQTYVVGLASNRVGVRLEGDAMPHALSLPSEPAIPGVIQIPPNGQPIVLGPDGPTIGGYPKIAVVIGADVDLVGRLKHGDPLEFRSVSLEEACEATRAGRIEQERRIAELRIG